MNSVNKQNDCRGCLAGAKGKAVTYLVNSLLTIPIELQWSPFIFNKSRIQIILIYYSLLDDLINVTYFQLLILKP